METLAIIVMGILILTTQWYSIIQHRKATKRAETQANTLHKHIINSGVARQSQVKTVRSSTSTPIVDSNPGERRRSG